MTASGNNTKTELVKKEKQVKPKIKIGKLEKREARAGYFFVAPWIIGTILFLLIPLGQSFYYMWFNIRITPKGYSFNYIGAQNFSQIWLENPEFPQQLVTYIWQTLLEVPIIVVFALMIAMMLNGKIKLRALFRLIFFLPVIIVSGPGQKASANFCASALNSLTTPSNILISEI